MHLIWAATNRSYIKSSGLQNYTGSVPCELAIWLESLSRHSSYILYCNQKLRKWWMGYVKQLGENSNASPCLWTYLQIPCYPTGILSYFSVLKTCISTVGAAPLILQSSCLDGSCLGCTDPWHGILTVNKNEYYWYINNNHTSRVLARIENLPVQKSIF